MADGDRRERDEAEARSLAGFRPGSVLDGRYRLERLLAEGGMGSVWVGRQIALEREVAVKLLRVGTGPLRARLRREALALAAVHHPAVVAVFDYSEAADGTPYLVMELVRGETLGARVLRAGPLSASEAVLLMLPLLEGLAVAHRAGVVHRDIKPDNVVLAASTGGIHPKLLDFGIARLDRAAEARLTADGGFIGTPAYMAPEQVRGIVADERADVWGMAVVLYEMIAGKSPFGNEDVIAVIRRVVDEPPPYPRSARDLDGALWGILMAAMRKSPAERTPTALALRDALAGWLELRGFGPMSHAGRAPPSIRALVPPPLHTQIATTLESAAAPRSVDVMGDTAPIHSDIGDTAPTDSDTLPADAADQAPFDATGDRPSLDALIRQKLGQS